jgi:methylated-DNA-protein-cysteine methyltransferase-like protein
MLLRRFVTSAVLCVVRYLDAAVRRQVATSWNDDVLRVVREIPRGKVATYGQIAAHLGRPRGAREVGWALHACDDPAVPCHRVVNRHGRCAPHFAGTGPHAQRRRLAREGVSFMNGVVDLTRHRWEPAGPPRYFPMRSRTAGA